MPPPLPDSAQTSWKNESEETDGAAPEWKCESWSFQRCSWCLFQPQSEEPAAAAGGRTCLRLFGCHGDRIPPPPFSFFKYFIHQRPGGPACFIRPFTFLWSLQRFWVDWDESPVLHYTDVVSHTWRRVKSFSFHIIAMFCLYHIKVCVCFCVVHAKRTWLHVCVQLGCN